MVTSEGLYKVTGGLDEQISKYVINMMFPLTAAIDETFLSHSCGILSGISKKQRRL